MGINVDDSLRLTKFIQQGTTNSTHRSLAQTIFSTPNMTLGKATLLFETYTPAKPSSSNVSVNAVICYFCRKKGHTAQNCQKKERHPKKKRDQLQPKDPKSLSRKAVTKRQRFPCVICKSTDHPSRQCLRRAEVKKCLAKSPSTAQWGGDEDFLDENN